MFKKGYLVSQTSIFLTKLHFKQINEYSNVKVRLKFSN